jgi:GxxExxY protein
MEFDELSRSVIGCAIEVHRNLGPGLLESTYRQCLAHELSQAGIPFQMELPLPVQYKGILLDCGYRIDLLVSGDLIVEIKSLETILPIHHAQTLTYMRLAKVPVGLLINFSVAKLQNGIKRFVLS